MLTLFSLAGLTAPPSVAWLMSRSKILRPPPDPESAVRLSSWAATTTLLSGALTPREALATIQRRQTMLDELELLDPQAFQEWLATLVERLGPVDLSSAVDPQRRDAA